MRSSLNSAIPGGVQVGANGVVVDTTGVLVVGSSTSALACCPPCSACECPGQPTVVYVCVQAVALGPTGEGTYINLAPRTFAVPITYEPNPPYEGSIYCGDYATGLSSNPPVPVYNDDYSVGPAYTFLLYCFNNVWQIQMVAVIGDPDDPIGYSFTDSIPSLNAPLAPYGGVSGSGYAPESAPAGVYYMGGFNTPAGGWTPSNAAMKVTVGLSPDDCPCPWNGVLPPGAGGTPYTYQPCDDTLGLSPIVIFTTPTTPTTLMYQGNCYTQDTTTPPATSPVTGWVATTTNACTDPGCTCTGLGTGPVNIAGTFTIPYCNEAGGNNPAGPCTASFGQSNGSGDLQQLQYDAGSGSPPTWDTDAAGAITDVLTVCPITPTINFSITCGGDTDDDRNPLPGWAANINIQCGTISYDQQTVVNPVIVDGVPTGTFTFSGGSGTGQSEFSAWTATVTLTAPSP